MTPLEKRGRTIVLIVIAVLFLPQFLGILVSLIFGQAPSVSSLVGVAIDAAVAWCLYRGYHWAFIYVPASLVLVGVVGILAALFATYDWWQRTTMFIIAVVHFVPPAVLWGSDSVHAYYEHHGRSRTVVLDLHSHDGV